MNTRLLLIEPADSFQECYNDVKKQLGYIGRIADRALDIADKAVKKTGLGDKTIKINKVRMYLGEVYETLRNPERATDRIREDKRFPETTIVYGNYEEQKGVRIPPESRERIIQKTGGELIEVGKMEHSITPDKKQMTPHPEVKRIVDAWMSQL